MHGIMKMKLVITGALLFVATFICFYTDSRKDELSNLLLKNVEALADSESGPAVNCLSSGSVDCPHTKVKVKYVIEDYSLEVLY